MTMSIRVGRDDTAMYTLSPLVTGPFYAVRYWKRIMIGHKKPIDKLRYVIQRDRNKIQERV